jgi:predicted transcriptional regulator
MMNDDSQSRREQIRRSFGLDYSGESSSSSSSQNVEQTSTQPVREDNAAAFRKGLGQALAALGDISVRILRILNDDKDRQDRIYSLVDKTHLDFDEMIRAVEQMSKLGFVQYVQKDNRGNHVIQLTDEGQSFLTLFK